MPILIPGTNRGTVPKKRTYHAEVEICHMVNGRAGISRSVDLTIQGLRRDEAHERAWAYAQRIRERDPDTMVSLHEARGVAEGLEVSFSSWASPTASDLVHELFHAEIAGKGIGTALDSPAEESAAYALERFADFGSRFEEYAAQTRARRMRTLARHSRRFLAAQGRPEYGQLGQESRAAIRRRVLERVGGDDTAIALNYAKNFVLYIECMEILKHFGISYGRSLLVEAVALACGAGLEETERFLIRALPAGIRRRIRSEYGLERYGIGPGEVGLSPYHDGADAVERRICGWERAH